MPSNAAGGDGGLEVVGTAQATAPMSVAARLTVPRAGLTCLVDDPLVGLPRDRALEAGAALDEAAGAIERAERRTSALWREVVGRGDDPFSTSLVDVSHALHHAARVLDRHAMHYAVGPTRSTAPAGRDPVRGLIGTGSEVLEAGGVTVERDGGRVRVRMWGEHDLSTVGLLSTSLVEAIAANDQDVVVDLGDVVFMDASTVGALVHGRALLAGRDRRLTVQSPRPIQRRLLQICDLADLIEAADGTPPRSGATTPLETWVEVPATSRDLEPVPKMRAESRRDDPERSRR